jgi:hypothetical protein
MLVEDVRRVRADERPIHGAHVAGCVTCAERWRVLSALAEAGDHFRVPSNDVCPDIEVLATLTRGRLRGTERQTLVEHLAGCPACRSAIALIAAGLRDDAPRRAARPWFRWLSPATGALAGAAAMFALMTVGPLAMPPAPGAPAPVVVGGARGPARGVEEVGPALRAVNPLGPDDVEFARDVWRTALEETENDLRDNPSDPVAREWHDVLQKGLAQLDARAPQKEMHP